jgi:integrase
MPGENDPKQPLEAFSTRQDGEPEIDASGTNSEREPAGRPVAPWSTPQLDALGAKARDYARNARSENTQRAYESDWRQFASWLRRSGFDPLPPDPQTVGLYLTACVEGEKGREPVSVATLERRLSGICWRYRQLSEPLDVGDPHIATVIAGIRRAHGRPPAQKEAIFAEDLLAMLATLENDLRGLRDRAILAIGFAGGLRRSEIVGLDCGPDQSEDGTGWIEIFRPARRPESEPEAAQGDPKLEGLGNAGEGTGADVSSASKEGGLLLTINGKTGWREVEIGRGSSPLTCPVAMLETWMRLGRIAHGPLFRRVARKNAGVTSERLTDKHVARLVQKTALAAGIRGDLSEGERKRAFSGHSLRAGLASSAQIEEAHVQRHLGHASAEMTRRYQRKRDRFRVNLTKAAGL